MVLLLAAGGVAAQPAGPAAPLPPGQSKITVVKRPYDTQALVAAEAAVPPDVYRGRTVWLQRCAYCHDGVGQPSYRTMGPWLSADMVKTMGEDRLKAFIGQGSARMPGFRYTLNTAQVGDLIAFLKTIGPDQKPTAAQLAGGEAVPGNQGE
jgi:mono/diheme cytochrome c family protein